MPKLLILFHARNAELATLADAIAAGARSVRFAEVDVRSIGEADEPLASRRALERIDDLASYDGIIVGVPSGQSETDALLTALTRFGGSLTDKVGSAFTTHVGADRAPALWSVLGFMADREMVLVPLPFTSGKDSGVEACRRMGERAAEVVGWVTHARSHHHHH
jgi:multimeric flavodoxin WrbA